MMKLLVYIAVLFLALVSAYGGSHRRSGGRGFLFQLVIDWSHSSGDNNEHSWRFDFCENETVAQSFLNQSRQLISDLQSNGSYGQALQKRAQFISYIQNDTNAELLSSNCTEYFCGLQDARELDKQALEQQKQNDQTVENSFRQLIQSLCESMMNSGDS
ncbi:unnamed protein product [Rotaria sordida]|uniref:Uncharacterized protein n=1 Tax=Rotaria sordida TaxID=392033 RepID=A0A815DA05_9BILA|nr:unnamed protein product [Rotaria sordida]CAF3832404.1 unnamed protein product [Rotaria sordida]CAF3897242.1 unnamed protein product [Rotaria sordida]